MTDDPYGALHRRFDKLEANFIEVREEQHDIAKNVEKVNHRVDLVELLVGASQQREELVVQSINTKLDSNSNMIKKLFDKFDTRMEKEVEDKKTLLFWLASCVVSVVGAASYVVFTKLFGG